MKTARITAVLLCLCLLTGCADMADSVSRSIEHAGGQAEYSGTKDTTAAVNYEVHQSVPKILVNQVGYKPESDKTAVFRGENLPSSFAVIDAETKAVVYTGKIEEKGYNEVLEEYNSYGVFSEVKEPGEYYIMADVVGMSYPFEIRENIYDDVLYESFRKYADNAEESETELLCEELSVLLLSLELYADSYTDDMNIPESGNGIPDMLDVIKRKTEQLAARQNPKTGGVGTGAQNAREENTIEENANASMHYAAVMAKFANTYKSYDRAYADICLNAAGKAFAYAQSMLPELDRDIVYYAAAELYRVTGAAKYYALLNEYISLNNRKKENGTTGFFYGDITYLSTVFVIDTKICETLMNDLMDRVEKLVRKSKAEEYLTCGNREQDNNSELLSDMVELAVVNYIIANHEYDTVLENHLHYFLGRNTKCISYVENAGYTYCAEEDMIPNNEIMNARFLCMLSAIK